MSRGGEHSKHLIIVPVYSVTISLWLGLTQAIMAKDMEAATTAKTAVEDAQRENKTPAAGPPKVWVYACTTRIVIDTHKLTQITPFVDPEPVDKPAVTPNPNRPALSLKDPSAPVFKSDENANALKKKLAVHIDADGPKPPPVFSLTPASATFPM